MILKKKIFFINYIHFKILRYKVGLTNNAPSKLAKLSVFTVEAALCDRFVPQQKFP